MDKRFEKLPDLMKKEMRILQELFEVSEEIALASVLGVANLAVMPHYEIDTGIYGTCPINLFILAIVKTAGRKSRTYTHAMRGAQRYIDEQTLRFEEEEERFAREKKRYDKEMELYDKNLNDSNYITQNGAPKKPNKPTPQRSAEYVTSVATKNGIIDQLRTQPFIGLFSAEAGQFFNSHMFQGRDQSKSNEMTTFLTNCWDGSDLEKKIGQSGGVNQSIILKDRSVNMLFLLQMKMIRDVLKNKSFQEQGFTHRLLITQGDLKDQDMDISEESLERIAGLNKESEEFDRRIYELISGSSAINPTNVMPTGKTKVDRVKEKLIIEENQNRGGLTISKLPMKLNSSAMKILADFYNANRQRDQVDLQEYDGFVKRLHEHAVRVAATLTAFESRQIVGEREAECAVEIMNFFIEQRLKLDLGGETQNANLLDNATKLYNWMVKRWKTRGECEWTKREIGQYQPWFRKDITSEEQTKVLLELNLKGLCETTTDGKSTKTTLTDLGRDSESTVELLTKSVEMSSTP